MNVVLRAAPSIHIADHLSRDSKLQYGILLGKKVDTKLLLCEAFDLKEEGGNIDFDFLRKKLALIEKTSPHLRICGIYSTRATGLPHQSFFDQFTNNDFSLPEIYLEMERVGVIRGFLISERQDIPIELSPSESESIAVTTVQNHPNYSLEELELGHQNELLIALSLAQLQQKLQTILAQPSMAGPEQDRKVVHLAQLLTSYKQKNIQEKYQLTTSHVCLLAAQFCTVNTATTQVNRRIAGLSKSR